MSLFDTTPMRGGAEPRLRSAPLAERMRPRSLEEFYGQEHLLGPGKPLRLQIERDDAASLIFWGPPGVGKTTLAKIIARSTQASFIEFSAVLSGTTENPSFEINAALLSRCRVYTLRGLEIKDVLALLQRALADEERGLGALRLSADADALDAIA